ncbi:MAG: recombinase RmuC [Legionellales bacterium RIFCSPHIGHO2_12_FULL_35_11]|nr:MAG: recombinase RmuC [Legionellales bacterium RIFCSPHIGHO2_12_FULL_35_11]
MMPIFYLSVSVAITTFIIFQLWYIYLSRKHNQAVLQSITNQEINIVQIFNLELSKLKLELKEEAIHSEHRIFEKLNETKVSNQIIISDSIQKQMQDVREQISHSFKNHADSLTKHLTSITDEIRVNLHTLSNQVNSKLTEGFEKTSSTFIDIVKRLAIIDEAQRKITELSGHVVSLQDILVDKKARGAFGEVQLSSLIQNVLPPANYKLQYTLSNNKRADCMLFLPKPTGNLAIDAKFPLETYQKLINSERSTHERKLLEQQFRQDLQKHIKDIADKYIIANETTDGAIMFIPAESIFAEVHTNYPDIIAMSQKQKVWLVSPSTLMAVLTTARSVLKDDATRKQVHIIQEHLQALAVDFERFEKRMDKLSKHIDLAHQDVNEVNTSAKKIASRFNKIESVQLEKDEISMLD